MSIFYIVLYVSGEDLEMNTLRFANAFISPFIILMHTQEMCVLPKEMESTPGSP